MEPQKYFSAVVLIEERIERQVQFLLLLLITCHERTKCWLEILF